MAFIDMTGQKFGRLTVRRMLPPRSSTKRGYWVLCDCDCGKTDFETYAHYVRAGLTTSCGCFRSENTARINLKHGEGGRIGQTPEYRAWWSMINRCYCPSSTGFQHWGGRGITVCDRWRNSFALFVHDMGRKPSAKHSLDRWPNPDGNYEPSNCRWATALEQARNKSKTKTVF